ncbi:hydrogenase maturation factor [Sulfolobus sp. A20]|uniref:HypC/HybG/HupF family hydrogenase formation chaperone n=1 Tax=Sulfolobaceae TaxID=118883 RepID=UPI0008461760|nr:MULTISPECIES: HypC/HybG/HupF family hydrogenase formation chaperone [unclassified Sulfolobus]TRM77673.1 hydrogenase maturation factor [Sulfolobus sp. A20-N-F8]TRM79546.1 hydrogenase maturation factor [Sulfolobus sp. B5]TRM82276.1 hydrogenase maturation factor [Sulfolobus sp. D5]TRM85162.1 hydrogenase maturation factor [Sulfolobus sp. F3]TRM87490.1 hydrogenase maturation factor [Sulfolobus sp. C3]TRM90981.1 hydrogenase maturation factor [Sulfolobus sp. A20-N-G8]TRN00726.1 hydrogenase matur
MCLSLPAVVVQSEGMVVFVDYGNGNIQPVINTEVDVKPGDKVIVSYGMIISKISEEEFKELQQIQKEMVNYFEQL